MPAAPSRARLRRSNPFLPPDQPPRRPRRSRPAAAHYRDCYDSLMAGQEVIVVGAGIIGCSVARELARRGARVRMFEARTIGAGATQASAGILAPYIEAHDRGPLFDLGLRSLAMYDAFVGDVAGESGLPVEYRRCGTLEVAVDAATAERLRYAAQCEPALQWLDASAARGRE